jgi:methyl-accepting chemotaxis protein/methyl-accepting chemotaxis protein-1 (serine sensor receptor)
MNKMTIGKRFAVTAGGLLVFIVLLSAVALVGINRMSKSVEKLSSESVLRIDRSETMRSDILGLEAALLLHMHESTPDGIAKAEETIKQYNDAFDTDLQTYGAVIAAEDVEDRNNFDKLGPELTAVRQGWTGKVVELSRAGKQVEAFAAYNADVRSHIQALVSQLDIIVDWNLRQAADVSEVSGHTTTTSFWLTGCISTGALLFGVGLSWYMIVSLKRELTRTVSKLSENAEQVASAAGQVASSSQALAQGSSEQAASLEETSASSEEINSMARKNTENSRSAADLVTASEQKFVETNAALEQTVSAMNEINEQSGKISKIIKTIDEIAFQTNILALNAAVEAARAGEAGMGFAVVADEVRNLAQRAAQAAKDTASLIEESITKSGDGKAKVDQVAAAIQALTAEAATIKTLVDEVNLGSQEQSRGIDQIVKAISQMEQVTQKNAAGAEEGASAAEELTAQSETLKDVVARLDTMVGGTAASTRSLRPSPATRPASKKSPKLWERAASPAPRSPKPAAVAAGDFPLEDDFQQF